MSNQPPQDYPVVHDNNGLPDFTLQTHPVHAKCPHWQHQGVTEVQSKCGILQWLLCVMLCLVGCWCIWCIPFCISDIRDATHTWAGCKAFLGNSKPK